MPTEPTPEAEPVTPDPDEPGIDEAERQRRLEQQRQAAEQ